jgi:hypothetical protein
MSLDPVLYQSDGAAQCALQESWRGGRYSRGATCHARGGTLGRGTDPFDRRSTEDVHVLQTICSFFSLKCIEGYTLHVS